MDQPSIGIVAFLFVMAQISFVFALIDPVAKGLFLRLGITLMILVLVLGLTLNATMFQAYQVAFR